MMGASEPAPPSPSALNEGGVCLDSCRWASDGDCDDGGPGAESSACSWGTDCTDCGPRTPARPPSAPPPFYPLLIPLAVDPSTGRYLYPTNSLDRLALARQNRQSLQDTGGLFLPCDSFAGRVVPSATDPAACVDCSGDALVSLILSILFAVGLAGAFALFVVRAARSPEGAKSWGALSTLAVRRRRERTSRPIAPLHVHAFHHSFAWLAQCPPP